MNIIKNNLFLLSYVWKFKKSAIFIRLLISAIAASNTYIEIYFVKWMFDALEKKGSFYFTLFIVCISAILYLITKLLTTMYDNVMLPNLSLTISEKINSEMIDKAKSIDLCCYENPDFYNKYTRALAESDKRVTSVLNTLGDMISSILNISVIVSLVATIDITFVLFGVIAAIVVFTQSLIINRISYKESIEKTHYSRQQNYVKRVIYQIEYAKEIKLYPNLVQILKSIYKIGIHTSIKLTKQFGKKKAKILLIFSSIQLLFENILPWSLIALHTILGKITFGSVAATFNATSKLPYALNGLFYIIPQLYQHSLYIEDLREILCYESEMKESSFPVVKINDFNIISFKNVGFSYPNCGNETLKDITLDIKKNEKIAIVGANGSGKSTLLKLLIRLYDPTSGAIYIDNCEIKDIDIKRYREIFGLCFQDYMLYATTITENILMRKATNERDVIVVENALEKVGLLKKFKKLPRYLDTPLTKEFDESGLVLSGGEAQQIILARALVSEAKVIIFDEPSSALDPVSEAAINKLIFEVIKEKTIIIISHRLCATIEADTIYLMQEGKILESGTHDELLSIDGVYANLFNVQAQKYRKRFND